LTCSATNGSIVTRGAKIVWADVDPITGLIDPTSVEYRITPRTKAVIAVDWAGRACDYPALRIAATSRVPIIEDAAHRLYMPKQHGDYVCFSFGPIKHLSMGGYGGALLTPPHERKRAELLRWHGLDRAGPNDSFRCEQDISEVGYRYHMTDDQAVVGLANMSMALRNVNLATENAGYYWKRLVDVPEIAVPQYEVSCDYWLFGLIIRENRDGFMRRMAEYCVPTSRVHARNDKHTAFRAASVNLDEPLPGVDYFDAHQVNIPVGAWLTAAEREWVLTAVRNAVHAPVTA
jgi:dTDP-4-amino-4,6-dideoxygalactose transaminase